MTEDCLLKLYYLYEKSSKKRRELEDIICYLKSCFDFDDNGLKPVCASGSRWIANKLYGVVSKFGAYTCHLAALPEDSSVK